MALSRRNAIQELIALDEQEEEEDNLHPRTNLEVNDFVKKSEAEVLSKAQRIVLELNSDNTTRAVEKNEYVLCMRKYQNPDLLIFYPEIERTARRLRKARRDEVKAMAENRDNQNELPREVPIREYFRTVINTHYSGIARGTIAANNFELKPALINMVQQNQFGGAATTDLHLHLRTFLEITDTVKINGASDEIIRLRLFSFSLRDHARSWLQSLPLGSVTTWADLFTKFLSKYFPPAKSAQLKIDITNFRQREFEVLYEAWERYKELLRKCPNHGYADSVQLKLFYNGLDGPTRGNVDAAVGGTIFSKTPDGAYELLEQMTINSYQWPSERSGTRKPAGVYAVDPITSLTAQVSTLTAQIAAMNKQCQSTSDVALVTAEEEPIMEEAQYINNRGFGGYRGNPPPNTYHPGLRNHENFSYANKKNVLNPPPRFNTQKGEGKPSFEDLVGTFVTESGKRMARTESRLDNMETHMGSMGATMKSLETHIGQLANALKDQNKGQFPSNTEVNPREQCKAVTLRSGKEIGIQEPAEESVEILVEEDDGNDTSVREEKVEEPEKVLKQQPLPKVNLPYPQRFKKKGLDDQFAKFLEIFKKIHINIPFADALEQMPNYAKFIKDVMSKMRKLQEFETVKLTEESLTYPRGIVEDVLVKVDKFIFPADFVILDMEENQETPLIFGRPFLATGKALIDVHKGRMTKDSLEKCLLESASILDEDD
ncbi:uncharacterized protein [Primulina eburnea]|uniref:uncharacterized protein n=1 Tax=Primulina eburnea TaxID=1245227 RepID=UPI003C6CA794